MASQLIDPSLHERSDSRSSIVTEVWLTINIAELVMQGVLVMADVLLEEETERRLLSTVQYFSER